MDLIRSETIEARIRRHEVCSQAFRAGISDMGLEIMASEKLRSNTVTGVIADGIDIPDFLRRCMKKGGNSAQACIQLSGTDISE